MEVYANLFEPFDGYEFLSQELVLISLLIKILYQIILY